jgi:hypothetical protein
MVNLKRAEDMRLQRLFRGRRQAVKKKKEKKKKKKKGKSLRLSGKYKKHLNK